MAVAHPVAPPGAGPHDAGPAGRRGGADRGGPGIGAAGGGAVPQLRGAGAAGGERGRARSLLPRHAGDIDEPTAPFGLLDVQGDGSGIEEARLRLDPALALAIRAQARRLGVSAASLMHLAWSLVLARTTGRADVVFGTVLLGRMHAGEQAGRIMGLFINTLPFRVSIDRRDVPGALRQVQALLGELIAHEHAPLALAQRCSAVDAQVPLFTSLLNYRHAKAMPSAAADEEAGEDDGIELRVSEDRTNYPLTFSIDDLGDEFVFTAQVSAPVDPQRVCDFMQTAVTALLAALEQTAPAPLQALSDLDVLPAAERERVLPQQGALPPAAPVGECLHTLFEACVQRDPQATAVRLGEGSLSYDALNRQANRLARHLRGLGVGPDTPVAICVERGFDMIVALLAVLKAGGAYVPLDPAYASERLHFTVEDSRPVAILADAVGRAALGEDFLAAQPARVVDLGADAAAWADAPDGNLPAAGPGAAAPAHLAYVIYTSGSTGRPKGVMVEHRNVVRLFDATAHWFRFDETDVWTLFHSFSFDFSVWEIWGPLLHGGSLVIVPLETARSPRDFHALLCEQRVTVLNQTPSAFLQLSAAQGQAMDEGEAGRHSLRYVVFGGEALELRTLKPWYERNGHDTVLINMYGITETTVHVTYRPLAAADTARPGPSPIGEPIPDLRLYVLDGQCRPAPVGTIGELYVGGAGVARGYLNRPELTSERFIANPYADGERLYRSGDLGRWLPDGTVEYLGRNDFQVKIRGFRIELGEIEAKLAHCPEVQEVVVLAREDQPGEKRLVAYYIGTAAAEELRTLASANLPPYMVPVAYVRLDGFPLTPNGKLDRRALPAPEGGAFVQRAYEAPEGETEEKLAAIWAELLKLERVGRHDNFFDLGGHSLLVVRLVERMRSQSMFADIRILFTAPTLAELAAAVSFESSEVEVPANLIPELPEEAVSDGEFEEFRL
ncbi:hypothetical protein CCZ27_04240 [Thauera sinica]|nr:hypothetical protein CCZ27_04240 [Thauera sp. K11]